MIRIFSSENLRFSHLIYFHNLLYSLSTKIGILNEVSHLVINDLDVEKFEGEENVRKLIEYIE